MSYLDTKGRIFDIQRFSVHDGPGVRTIVFLKGCYLRCKWCCNPESQKFEIEQMNRGGKIQTVGEDKTVREIMETVERDRVYYRRSGGGLTLSGGESLVQHEFAAALLRAAKETGINTAIESTACAEYSRIEAILPYLDTYLMDIKHINSDKHREFTGRSNELILENAKKLANEKCNLIVRVPVIPTFNDTPQEIYDIAAFARSIGVKEIHLLPYHRLGTDKYTALGREYLMGHIDLIPKEKIATLQNVASSVGLICKIGG
ncbi:MAG: glycyl-radical enzyme activating protein [Clostridia bacterium]|nr:glycyl-radical enzyme activating protein [Clostridia bacterium]